MDRCDCDKRIGEGCPICNPEVFDEQPKFIQIFTYKVSEFQDKIVALDSAGDVWQYQTVAGWGKLNMKRLKD